jgi:beta-phosphoglucomutase-like phosphatase (HAD superfamily)
LEKIILVDVDGVLLDWNAGFCNWMDKQGFPFIPGTEHEYAIEKRHENVTFTQARKLIEEFNTSDELRTLQPNKDSQEFVAKLVDEGFRFIAVTAVSDDPVAGINRRYNLEQVFGDIFDEIHCTPLGESKQVILRENWGGTGLIWIEDHFKNAEAGYEEGLRSVLVDTPYNRHFMTDLFPRVDAEKPWADIYKIVHDLYR